MTATIARLVLAMLLLPATGAVFLLAFVAIVASRGLPNLMQLLMVWTVVYAFVAVYWTLLWRSLVRWTSTRIIATLATTGIALAIGLAVGVACRGLNGMVQGKVLVLIGGGTVPITWVLGTVIVWRETPAERAKRLGKLGAIVVCPLCGYNLAGLRDARCPECGTTFTLDQLVATQPRGVAESTEI